MAGYVRFDYDEIVRLTKLQLSAAQIANRLGCTTRTVQRVRAAAGIRQPLPENACRPVSEGRLEAARRMFEDGASRKEVKRTLGLHRDTIEKHFPGTGWSRREGGELIAAIRRARAAGIVL